MAVDHDRIRKILAEKDEQSDTSLRGHSLRRALQQQVPKTLTPHEWEQWYAEHGVPDSHRSGDVTAPKKRWWRFWKR